MVTSHTSACLLPCLILGHTVLHCVKITDSLTGLTLCKIDASAWDLIFQLRLRNLHIAGNLVTEAQIFINIGGRHLARGNGADYSLSLIHI